MNPSPLSRARRCLAVATVLSLSFGLAACGGDDESAADPNGSPSSAAGPSDEATPETPETPDSVLTEDEMTPALLTPSDLPAGFVVDPDDDEESDDSFVGSCLEEVGKITDQPEFDADAKVEASYVLNGDAGQSSVKSQVQSYADQDQVVSGIAMFSEVVGGCDTAAGTDPDGTAYDLEVLSDQTVSLTGVDEQARVAINGTITTGGLELPVDIGYNVARVGPNLVIISTLDVGETGDSIVEQTDVVAQVSVDRLAEITAG